MRVSGREQAPLVKEAYETRRTGRCAGGGGGGSRFWGWGWGEPGWACERSRVGGGVGGGEARECIFRESFSVAGACDGNGKRVEETGNKVVRCVRPEFSAGLVAGRGTIRGWGVFQQVLQEVAGLLSCV